MWLHKPCVHRGYRNEWTGQQTGGERELCVKVPVESRGCWQRGEEIWPAAGIREHLTGPVAAG